MQIFLVFLLFSFIGGTLFWKEKVSKKAVAIVAIALVLVVGYFFFYQL